MTTPKVIHVLHKEKTTDRARSNPRSSRDGKPRIVSTFRAGSASRAIQGAHPGSTPREPIVIPDVDKEKPTTARSGSSPRPSRAASNPRSLATYPYPASPRAGSSPRALSTYPYPASPRALSTYRARSTSRAGSNPRPSRAGSSPRTASTYRAGSASRSGSNPRPSRTGSNPRTYRAGSALRAIQGAGSNHRSVSHGRVRQASPLARHPSPSKLPHRSPSPKKLPHRTPRLVVGASTKQLQQMVRTEIARIARDSGEPLNHMLENPYRKEPEQTTALELMKQLQQMTHGKNTSESIDSDSSLSDTYVANEEHDSETEYDHPALPHNNTGDDQTTSDEQTFFSHNVAKHDGKSVDDGTIANNTVETTCLFKDEEAERSETRSFASTTEFMNMMKDSEESNCHETQSTATNWVESMISPTMKDLKENIELDGTSERNKPADAEEELEKIDCPVPRTDEKDVQTACSLETNEDNCDDDKGVDSQVSVGQQIEKDEVKLQATFSQCTDKDEEEQNVEHLENDDCASTNSEQTKTASSALKHNDNEEPDVNEDVSAKTLDEKSENEDDNTQEDVPASSDLNESQKSQSVEAPAMMSVLSFVTNPQEEEGGETIIHLGTPPNEVENEEGLSPDSQSLEAIASEEETLSDPFDNDGGLSPDSQSLEASASEEETHSDTFDNNEGLSPDRQSLASEEETQSDPLDSDEGLSTDSLKASALEKDYDAQAKEVRAALMKKLEESEESNIALVSDLEQLRQTHASLKKDFGDMQLSNSNLTEKLKLSEERHCSISKDLEELQRISTDRAKEFLKAKSVNVLLSKKLHASNDTNTSLVHELDTLKLCNHTLTRDLGAAESANEKLTRKLQDSEASNRVLVLDLDQTKETSHNIHKDMGKLKSTNLSLTRQLDESNENNRKLTRSFENLKTSNAALVQELGETKQTNENLQHALEAIESKNGALVKDLEEAKSDSRGYKSVIDGLKNQLSSIKDQLTMEEEKTQRAHEDFHQMQQKFKDICQKHREGIDKMSNLKIELHSVREEVETCHEKEAVQTEKLQRSTRKQDEYKSQIADLKMEKNRACEQVKRTQEEISRMTATIKHVKEQNRVNEDSIDEQKSNIKTLSLRLEEVGKQHREDLNNIKTQARHRLAVYTEQFDLFTIRVFGLGLFLVVALFPYQSLLQMLPMWLANYVEGVASQIQSLLPFHTNGPSSLLVTENPYNGFATFTTSTGVNNNGFGLPTLSPTPEKWYQMWISTPELLWHHIVFGCTTIVYFGLLASFSHVVKQASN